MPYNNNPYQTAVPMQNYQNGSYQTAVPMNYTQQVMPNSYTPTPHAGAPYFGDWVDGEDAARVYQFPPNWPNDTPLTLWDINEDVFYVKSKDSFGRPLPIKKARFTWEQPKALLPGQSGHNQYAEDYATKDDLKALESKLLSSLQSQNNRGTTNSGNRNGGHRE